jgi:hypothetical protein
MGILPRQIILPPLIQEPANPQPIGHEMQEAINLGMNVHTQVLTDAFKKRIDGLAQQFPEYFQGNTTQKHQEMQTIECRLWGYIFEHSPRNQKTTQQAITIGCTMFKKSYNPDNQYYNDFVYTPGRVLCYVVLSIEAQWLKTPKNQLKEAKRNALGLLIDFLNNGQGFCDTRLIEEILQIVNVPLSQHAAEQATLGESSVALAVSEEQIRDTVFPIAQNTLKTLLKLEEPLEHYVLQYIFFTTVLNSVLKDHPNIPEEPLTNYLNHHILEHWQVFVESVD